MRGPSLLNRALPASRLPATGAADSGLEVVTDPPPAALIRLARALGAAAAREAFRAAVEGGASAMPEDGQ